VCASPTSPTPPCAGWWSPANGDDKAGAYAVQGLAGAFVERVDGSFSNVVGLPFYETLQLLAAPV